MLITLEILNLIIFFLYRLRLAALFYCVYLWNISDENYTLNSKNDKMYFLNINPKLQVKLWR